MSRRINPEEMVSNPTLFQRMPKEVSAVLKKNNLKIKMRKADLQKFFDQTKGMMSKDGCISSPSGPSC